MDHGAGILHDGEIQAQRLFGVEERGQKMARAIHDYLSPGAMAFIQAQRFFFLATSNRLGTCDCSFRGSDGDDESAVVALSDRELVFPDFSGNNLYNSLGNILDNPQVGLLFIDFSAGARYRVNGGARLILDKTLYQHLWPTAQGYIHVAVVQAFANCSKRIPRMAEIH